MTDSFHNPAHAPEAESFYDKYLVHDPREIHRYLERLLEGRCTLLGHVEGGNASTVTVLLQVDDASYRVDVPRSQDDQRIWSNGAKLFFEGSLDRVALRFHSGPGQLVLHDGRPALALPLPTRMLHLQRREFLRLEPPLDSVRCRVPAKHGDEADGWIEATIRDIGGGGLAVLAPSEEVAFAVGDVITGCEIDLPDSAPLVVNLCVRHVVAQRRRGKDALQAGCEFVDLPPGAQDRLFRYVMQLDRQRAQRGRP
jgi:c-di-GMP-binding flagellar brake protein YcgR